MARTRRFGLKAMVGALRRFCGLYVKFKPILLVTYTSTHPIIIAGNTVMAACEQFIDAVGDEIEPGV